MLTEDERLFLKLLEDGLGIAQIEAFGSKHFWEFAKEYRLTPFIYTLLIKEKAQQLPLSIKEYLKEQYILNLRKQLLHVQDILKIAKAFNQEKVPLLLLKGPFLAKRIYADEGARRVGCDLDILIRFKDFKKAHQLFEDLGYVRLPPANGWASSDFYKQFIYLSLENKSTVDLHFKFLGGVFTPDFTDLTPYWKDCLWETRGGVSLSFFSNEILFLYLCLLLCKETIPQQRLQYILDLYYFLERYKEKLDYAYLAQIINESKLNGYILFSLNFLEQVLKPLSLPKAFLKQIEMARFRKEILLGAIERYWATEKVCFRLKKYGLQIITFSRGYLRGVLSQIHLLYKVSYLYFLEENNLKHSWLSMVSHFFFFIQRAFSSRARKIRKNEYYNKLLANQIKAPIGNH